MMRVLRVAAALAVVLMVVGCAKKPEIPFERAAEPQIKTIGIVTPGFPDGPSVVLATSIGQSFGLIGALVDAGMRANRENTFEAAMQSRRFSAADSFLGDLTAGLQAEGYQVVDIPMKRESTKFVENYAGAPQQPVDAYLDIYTQAYGYLAAGIGDDTPYRPVLYLEARLVRASDKAVLMTDRIRYNPLRATDNVISIAPDPAYDFKDFDTLIGHSDAAMAGLHASLGQSAHTVCALLK
jgi:hypothetical protein